VVAFSLSLSACKSGGGSPVSPDPTQPNCPGGPGCPVNPGDPIRAAFLPFNWETPTGTGIWMGDPSCLSGPGCGGAVVRLTLDEARGCYPVPNPNSQVTIRESLTNPRVEGRIIRTTVLVDGRVEFNYPKIRVETEVCAGCGLGIGTNYYPPGGGAWENTITHRLEEGGGDLAPLDGDTGGKPPKTFVEHVYRLCPL